MNTILRFLIIFLAAASSGFGIRMSLSIDDLLGADFIARVTILSVTDMGSDPGYKKLARGIVTDAAKGAKVGDAIDIVFSPTELDDSCGSVHYEVRDDCIVVARRRPSDRFETMNESSGKYEIHDGRYINPRWFKPYGQRSAEKEATELRRMNDFRNKPPEEILAGLRRLLPEIERERLPRK